MCCTVEVRHAVHGVSPLCPVERRRARGTRRRGEAAVVDEQRPVLDGRVRELDLGIRCRE